MKSMEGRFQHGFCIKLAGPSNCGKTCTLLKLLEKKHYFTPQPPSRIIWISGSGVRDVEMESKIMSQYPDSEFHYQIPDDIENMARPFDLFVFDDLSGELQNNAGFTNCFTKVAHHKNCIFVYLTQNAFEKGRDATTRTRNCSYQIYFNNKTDVRWVRVLGDQLMGDSKKFTAIFKKAMHGPFSCLLVDNRPSTPPNEQFIGNAFEPTRENPCYFLTYK
jgi:hypothetical protein